MSSRGGEDGGGRQTESEEVKLIVLGDGSPSGERRGAEAVLGFLRLGPLGERQAVAFFREPRRSRCETNEDVRFSLEVDAPREQPVKVSNSRYSSCHWEWVAVSG